MSEFHADSLFVDLSGRDAFVYNFFLKEAKKFGMPCNYMAFDCLDTLEKKHVATSKVVFYAYTQEFLLCTDTPLVQKAQELLRVHAQQKNQVITFILPSLSHRAHVEQIMKSLLASLTGRCFSATDPLVQRLSALFSSSPDRLPIRYHTALRLPTQNFFERELDYKNNSTNKKEEPVLLPVFSAHNKSDKPWLKALMPFGCYYQDVPTGNHIFFLRQANYSILSLSENFHSAPFDECKRVFYKQLYSSIIFSIASCAQHGHLGNFAQALKKEKIKDNQKSMRKKRKIAWMELVCFEPYDKHKNNHNNNNNNQENNDALTLYERRQKELIEAIFDADLDTLWLSITPNIYFSPIARMVKKDDPAQTKKNLDCFCASLSRFTFLLKKEAARVQKKIPKLMIGFEITNNIYPPHLPRSYAVDCFGNQFEDLPAPLNRIFWYNEVLLPLRRFLKLWQRPEICHGLSISGVMIDGEMYCRKKTGLFTPFMGFDKNALVRFARKKALVPLREILSSDGPIQMNVIMNYLIKNKLLALYWGYLEKESLALGDALRDGILRMIPEAELGVYLPNIVSNWFYNGLLQGLSKNNKKPLLLLTFNTAYAEHKPFFVRNNISVKHLCVFMLSKAQSPEDAQLMQRIFAEHDGVWYNRFSRFAEPYNGESWTSIEQSPMTKEQRKAFFNHINNFYSK